MNSTKSWKKPTPEQVGKTLALLVHPKQRDYFFSRLENPEWIAELKEKKWFNYPPPVIQNDNNTVSFPNWAESRYLARMAVRRPEEVLEIILTTETDNPSVFQDFVEAALNMPPVVAKRLDAKVIHWIENSPYSFYPLLAEKIGQFVSHLSKGRQIEVALKITRSLLAIQPDSRFTQEKLNKDYYFSPKPRTRFDEWHYNKILQKNIPDLVVVAEEEALLLLCSLLQDALRLSYSLSQEREEVELIWEDCSYIWRASIENSSRNFEDQDLKSSLVTTIRDSTQLMLIADSSKLTSITILLTNQHWRVFHRLAIHLIRQFPKVDSSLVTETLINPYYFDCPRFHQDYEYALLASEQFANLSKENQETILSWIDSPGLEQSEADTLEQYNWWLKRWQVRKLTPLKNMLSDEWQHKYDELVHDVGSFKLTDLLPSGVQGRPAYESPKTIAELAVMEVEDLIEFLNIWQPNHESSFEVEGFFDKPSKEGLALTLQKVIEANPLHYAAATNKFRGLPIKYVASILRGLHKLLNYEQNFEELVSSPWFPIVSLCQWVIEESCSVKTREIANQLLYSEWRGVRQVVADILSLGLSAENQLAIPLTLRKELWAVLAPLTSDPDPTPDYEMKYGGANKDSIDHLSINTVRGEAIHTVIRYALWLRRSQQEPSGFDEMPEVRQVLENHLDPNADPSLAIRSIYGQWLPWLTLISESWVIQNIVNIFPTETGLEKFRRAAWNAYIVFCSPYDNVFKLLVDQYSYAIDQLNSTSDTELSHHDPNKGLAQHLMTFCWRGQLSLDDSGLLTKFYKRSSVFLRKEAMEFIGHSLKNTKETLDPDIQTRLIALWESRLLAIQQSTQSDVDKVELTAYGWWFTSAKFDALWAIGQLRAVLDIIDYIEADHFVVEQLAELAETHLQLVLECLQIIIERNKTEWGIYSWNNEARKILMMALQSDDLKNQQIAKAVIDSLGRKGYWEFRELL